MYIQCAYQSRHSCLGVVINYIQILINNVLHLHVLELLNFVVLFSDHILAELANTILNASLDSTVS
jgi:hypothetical protein